MGTRTLRAQGRRRRFDRLSVADLMMLRPEDLGWREDIGALALLRSDALVTSDGSLRLDAIRDAVARRLPLVPRFRQVLLTPGWGRGGPLWSDAPRFDVADHVGVVDLPPKAGEAALLDEVERLRIRPFDRSRPLWEMWFLTGLEDGRTGLYVKLHHAMADGMAGVMLLGAFLDPEPSAPELPLEPWEPAQPPTGPELLVDNLSRRVASAAGKIAHPVAWYRELRSAWDTMRETLGQEPAPITSANQPIGESRVMALVPGDLDRTKRVGHARGGTANDVLMAAVTGGYRELLETRGEPVDGVTLRASVPVSLHDEGGGGSAANDDGMMFVSLPIGIGDPGARLDAIAKETADRKQHVYRPPGLPILGTRVAQHAMWRQFDHQRWSNAYVANVPGPTAPLYFAGALVEAVFPIVPIMGNLTIGVGAMSYAGQFNITIVADATTCGDVEVFASGVRESLHQLADPALAVPRLTGN